jgi:hypothetical protein
MGSARDSARPFFRWQLMATYYVDTATGSDADDGLSEANAWLTVQKAADTAVAGDLVYIKAGSYAEQVDFDTNAGAQATPIRFVGYTATPGDDGKATITGSASRASCIVCTTTADYVQFKNIIFTAPTTQCVLGPGAAGVMLGWRFINCEFTKGSATPTNSIIGASAYSSWATLAVIRCTFSGFSSHGFFPPCNAGAQIIECKLIDNGGDGIRTRGYVAHLIKGCIIAGNTGDGIFVPSNGGATSIINNTIQGNTGDGIEITATGAGSTIVVMGNVIVDHSGGGDTGFKHGTQAANVNIFADRNFYFNNTTDRSGAMATGDHDVVLSGDPFTASGSDNWTLNNTAGAGASVRAAYGPAFDGTNIGYADAGAIQHQDAGGGGDIALPPGSLNGGIHQ